MRSNLGGGGDDSGPLVGLKQTPACVLTMRKQSRHSQHILTGWRQPAADTGDPSAGLLALDTVHRQYLVTAPWEYGWTLNIC